MCDYCSLHALNTCGIMREAPHVCEVLVELYRSYTSIFRLLVFQALEYLIAT